MIERPSWADFTTVQVSGLRGTPLHVRSGGSFDGTVRTQCGSTLKRPEQHHSTRSELDDNTLPWCPRCRDRAKANL